MRQDTLSLPTRFNIYVCTWHTRVHFFPRFRMLRATSQRRWWLELKAAKGAASYTSDASRHTCCLSKRDKLICVAPNSFTVRMASYFYGLPSTRIRVFFFWCVCSRFFLNKRCRWCPRNWLKGAKWDGMPYHVTLGLAILGGGLLRRKVEVC